MPKQTEPRVQPVRRYKVPRYPSHQDPDPTRHPQPIPYPAGRQLLTAVASLGLAASASCSRPDDAGSGASGQTVNAPIERHPYPPPVCYADDGQPISVETEHALDLAFTGLPHRTSPYGTGVPNYIDEELAREVVAEIFRDHGYQLKPKVPMDEDGMKFVLDGYDQDKKIGFVVGGYGSLDVDACISWQLPEEVDWKARIDFIRSMARYYPDLKPLMSEIETAQAIPDAGKRDLALQAIAEKHQGNMLSLAEIKQLDQQAKQSKRFVAVISQFDRRFETAYVDYQEIEKIEQIPDVGKRDLMRKELERKAAQKAIEQLELSVRDYIAWARSQGAG